MFRYYTDSSAGSVLMGTVRHWGIVLGAVAFAMGCPLGAQTVCTYGDCHDNARPTWRTDPVLFAANSGIGAIAVVAIRLIEGKTPTVPEIAVGFLGGATVFAGKRIAAEPFWGSGLLGRQLSSLGGSLVYGAGHGSAMFSHANLNIGPLRLHLHSEESPTVRVDLTTVIAAPVLRDCRRWSDAGSGPYTFKRCARFRIEARRPLGEQCGGKH